MESVPDENKLRLAFERGAALLLPNNFEGADILIPIRVCNTAMSFCLIQVKNRKYDKSTPGLKTKAVLSLTAAMEALKMSRNHIGIMMCLRNQPTATDDGGDDGSNRVNIVLPQTTRPRTTRRIATNHPPGSTSNPSYNWPKKGKRMVALAMGFDEQLYPSIEKCKGERTEETSRILPLLQRLLDCVPGTSLPGDLNDTEVEYVRRMKTVAL